MGGKRQWFGGGEADGGSAPFVDGYSESCCVVLHAVAYENRSPGVDIHLPEHCILKFRQRFEHGTERTLETKWVVPFV